MVTVEQVQANTAIIATGVTAEDYLAQYAGDFCEWIEGDVIKMSPVHTRHDYLTQGFLSQICGQHQSRD